MYKVIVEDSFYAEHAVMMPDGVLEQRHGHNWSVKVCASAMQLDRFGFAFEFGKFQHALNKVIRKIGENLNSLPIEGEHPTTELVCKYFYNELSELLPGIGIDYVEIEEEKGCLIRYCRD